MPNQHQFKYLYDLNFKNATGLSKSVFDQMKQDFTMAEPFTISYPSEQQLVYRWMLNREAYLVNTNVERVLKDAVAYGVSIANQCPFCAEGHEMMIAASGHRQEAKLIQHSNEQNEGKIFSIANWAKQSYDPTSDLIKSPPFSPQEAPELIGTFYCFNVTNRLANLFLGESPVPIPKNQKLLRSMMAFVATRFVMKPFVTRKLESGKSLSLASLPAEEHSHLWTQEVPTVSTAFSAVLDHLNKIEKESIPKVIVEKVVRVLENWNGQKWPPRGQWLNEQMEGIDTLDQPLYKLALLVMFASYSVTEEDILAFRELHPEDQSLIDLCYWAANKVSIRMLDWIAKPFTE